MASKPRFAAADPTERFVDLAGRLGYQRPPAVTPESLRPMIKGTDPSAVKEALTMHLARKTVLTDGAAAEAVGAAFEDVGGDQKALTDSSKTADAVSKASNAAAASFSGTLKVSDPVMLGPWSRFCAAFVMAVGLIMSIVCVLTLSRTSSNWAYGALTALGIASLLGVIILVMGYKNVDIEGSGSPP